MRARAARVAGTAGNSPPRYLHLNGVPPKAAPPRLPIFGTRMSDSRLSRLGEARLSPDAWRRLFHGLVRHLLRRDPYLAGLALDALRRIAGLEAGPRFFLNDRDSTAEMQAEVFKAFEQLDLRRGRRKSL